MSDVLSAVGSYRAMAATMSDLGGQLASAATNGDFAAVLSKVNSELQTLTTGQTTASASGTDSASGAEFASLPSATTGAQVVADAKKYLGVPYLWGGTNPSVGLDCSGFVQRVYSDLGVQLPRTSQEQATVGTPVASLAQAQPGDLLFFEPSASGPGHVGIYLGNGQMIDSPHTGTVVQIEPVWGEPSAIRRVLPSDSSGTDVAAGNFADLLAASGMSGTSGASGSGSSTSTAGSGSTVSVSAADQAGMNALGVPAELQGVFASAGSSYGVDPLLLASVAKQESGFNPSAVSGAGAEGLMQLMPATAAGLGVSPMDPASAVDGAAQLLSGYLGNYGGSVPLSLAAYNAGPGAVATYGGVPPYGETQNYVSSITSMLAQARSAAASAGVA